MAWVDPDTQKLSVGDLVTESLWDQIQDNLKYLKGASGAVTIDDDISCEEITCVNITTDGGFFSPPNVREVRITWEDDGVAGDYQVANNDGGAGSSSAGGTGQVVQAIQDDAASVARLENQAEQNNALDTSFNASRHPYMRAEFAISDTATNLQGYGGFFVGLRETLGDAAPDDAAENFAGVWYNLLANGLYCRTGDGAGNDNNSSQVDWTANQRYVVEIIFTGSAVQIWLNGVIQLNATSNLPTGDLEWQLLFYSDGTGAGVANIKYMTHGQVLLQEDLS